MVMALLNDEKNYRLVQRERVFSRWKLILIMVIGVWVVVMIPEQPIFAIIYGLLWLWEFTKKG